MSRIHLKSHTVALWLSMAVAAAGAVSVSCSSSSNSDDSAAGASAGKTGGAGKSGSGDTGGDTSTPADGGAAGTPSDTPAGGGDTTDPGSSDAGSGGTGSDGGDDAPGDAGAGGGAPVTADPTAAAVARAKKLIAGLDTPCVMCHQANYAGANYWPNITPDMDTGIGSWSDDDIKTAITKGKDPDGKTFCAEMQQFKFTDSQLSDVLTFLRNLKPVSKSITKPCTTK